MHPSPSAVERLLSLRHRTGSSHSLWLRSLPLVSKTSSGALISISAVSIYPILERGQYRCMLTPFSVLNFLFLPLIYFFYPETRNLSLEQVDKLFTGGKITLHWTPSMGEVGDVAHRAPLTKSTSSHEAGTAKEVENAAN